MRLLIFDPAHGSDTPGKRSPDGKHREYLWARKRFINVYNRIVAETKIPIFAPFLQVDIDVNMLYRIRSYNRECGGQEVRPLLISLHNDAENPNTCDADGWGKASGAAFWTSRGEDNSDKESNVMYNHFRAEMPDEKYRTAYWLGRGEKVKDPDYEANFNILVGKNGIKPQYDAVLIEWLFQTNKRDVKKLMTRKYNKQFEDSLFNLCVKLGA